MRDIEPYEFVVSLDGEPAKIIKEGGTLKLQLRNPHAAGQFEMSSLSMLKVLIKKINQTSVAKPIPSDDQIKAAIRKVKMNYINNNDGTKDFNVELFKEAWRISQS